MKQVHFAAIDYTLNKEDEVNHGIAVIEAPGLASVLLVIDNQGRAVTAPDGGSPDLWWYRLNFHTFAVTANVEE